MRPAGAPPMLMSKYTRGFLSLAASAILTIGPLAPPPPPPPSTFDTTQNSASASRIVVFVSASGSHPPIVSADGRFTLRSSSSNTSALPPGILGGEPRAPYASSDGIVSSHLSPSRMSCIASVHPLMTWFGANVAGRPRRTLESKTLPSGSVPW